MDMKKILQAMDGVSTKPVEGSNDMAKFLRVVSEAEINQPATPTPPPMPSIDGLQVGQTKEVNPGEKVTLKADGTVSHEGWWGEQIFNTNGQLVKTISPRFNGYQQQTDPTGKVISKTQSITNPDGQEMGSVTQNADGTQSSNVDLGTTVLSQQRDANGNLANGTATVRGETPAQNQTVTMEDVKRLAGIITEGANPHKVALPVQMAMQHFQQPKPVVEKKPSLLRKYFVETEEEISQQLAEEEASRRQRINMYAQKIADRVLMKEGGVTLGGGGFTVDDQIALNQRMQAQASGATAGGVPIGSTPPGINRLTGKPVEPVATPSPSSDSGTLSSRYGPGYEGSPAAYTITVSGKDYKFAGRDKSGPGTGPIIKVPGGAVGIRGLAPVSVELGNDGMFYTAPVTNESPIEMTGDPNDPHIYGHQKANPMSLKGRIMQARAQLKELAQAAESDNLAVWQDICAKAKGGMFMGLEQNLEQIRHGISELAAKRKQGGIASRGIDKNISEMSVSQKQARTMAAAAHDPKFAKKLGIKQSVAKEFNKADTGTKQLSQAMKKKK